MALKFYGKSSEVAEKIISNFESGNVPKALAQVFVDRSDNIPSSAWSWRNRFLTAIHGTTDARGFKQWKATGRKVSKGSKAFHILGPCIGKRTEQDAAGNDKEVAFLYGFKSIPVFGIEETEVFDEALWEKNGGTDLVEENRLKDLPLAEVAELWNLKVTSYNGKGGGSLGYYKHGKAIALGTENLSTWTHELVHAAENKLGTLTKKQGQDPGNEIVAELGGAVLLHIMNLKVEADQGGAWDYIKAYSKNDKSKALTLCGQLLDRVCKSVDLIIETATNLEVQEAA